jgi:hypothetical protein
MLEPALGANYAAAMVAEDGRHGIDLPRADFGFRQRGCRCEFLAWSAQDPTL